MDVVKFNRTVRLCLDTLDVDIFTLLTDLKSKLNLQHSTFYSEDAELQTSSLREDYIPLTFIKEVDTRTLPVTEGSDAELQILIKNTAQETHYVDAQREIYSISSDGQLMSIIGHPGTGKTIFCLKLINRYAFSENETYRFVLFIVNRERE